MPTEPHRKPSRTISKRHKYIPQLPSKSRPGLAVDTSFSRHHGSTPEQVFPYESKTEQPGFISLSDVRALRGNAPEKPKTRGGSRLKQQLEDKAYVSSKADKIAGSYTRPQAKTNEDDHSTLNRSNGPLQSREERRSQSTSQAPPMHKRVKGLRPAPLDLSHDVSPSDRVISIGIALPSTSLSNHTHSPASTAPYPHSPLRSQQSQRYGAEATTPTIVITPAKEDFESWHGDSPEDVRRSASRRLHWNANPTDADGTYDTPPPYERTPPVPPLPSFATESNASLRDAGPKSTTAELQARLTPSSRSGNALSVCTVFEEENLAARSPYLEVNAKRRSTESTIRRSKGWWNVLTSPFSAKSTAFSFRSPTIMEEDEDDGHLPILTGASDMGRSDRSGAEFMDHATDGADLRSAPPTDCSTRSFESKRRPATPKRADTAPGALDLGNADEVNIYRIPDEGAGASYYDPKRNFPSIIGAGPPSITRSIDDLDGFDPRQSCYQEPKDSGMRNSEFYRIPSQGEAAPYYDSNRTFPSVVPHGLAYGDPGMEDWSPSRSISRESRKSSIVLDAESGELAEASTEASSTRGVDEADSKSPFDDSHAVGLQPYSTAPTGHGQVVERSPFDSGHAEFEGFSGAYAPTERKFFSTPSKDEFIDHSEQTPRPPLAPRNDSNGQQSFMSDTTPVVEDAHLATFMPPPRSADGKLREVEVSSTRTQTPTPASTVGLGNATMASRNYQEPAYSPYKDTMSEKAPYSVSTHSRNDSQGLGISDHDSERALFPPPQLLSEKASGTSESSMPPTAKRNKRTGPPWYRRFCCLLTLIGCTLLAGLIIILVMFVPLRHHQMPVQAQWLNLTGFPPLPTGIATVIGPDATKDISGCVSPQQLWSCAVPPNEGQHSATSNEPNFRFEIMFRNHMLPSNETAIEPSNITLSKRSSGQAAQAGAVVRRGLFWTNSLFSSAPSPPSVDDQSFLGKTTDHVIEPYDGEETPFYLSLLNTSALVPSSSAGLRKRDQRFKYPYPTTSSASPSSTASNKTSPTPSQVHSSDDVSNTPEAMPDPALGAKRMPVIPQLYPLAYAQPLRLFNRDQDSEHYGFYTYFDRSLYVSSTSHSTPSSNSTSLGTDITGNVPLNDATAVCTWSQTRLLVQIWTKRPDVRSLNATVSSIIPAFKSSAYDMSAPGSFPYPVTVTLDRHGGEASAKGIYCYGLNEEHQVIDDLKTWVAENRGFGGTLVHPAPVPMNNGTSLNERRDGGYGGTDGGSGGCACQWRNW